MDSPRRRLQESFGYNFATRIDPHEQQDSGQNSRDAAPLRWGEPLVPRIARFTAQEIEKESRNGVAHRDGRDEPAGMPGLPEQHRKADEQHRDEREFVQTEI